MYGLPLPGRSVKDGFRKRNPLNEFVGRARVVKDYVAVGALYREGFNGSFKYYVSRSGVTDS
jgi:hypothetical protein